MSLKEQALELLKECLIMEEKILNNQNYTKHEQLKKELEDLKTEKNQFDKFNHKYSQISKLKNEIEVTKKELNRLNKNNTEINKSMIKFSKTKLKQIDTYNKFIYLILTYRLSNLKRLIIDTGKIIKIKSKYDFFEKYYSIIIENKNNQQKIDMADSKVDQLNANIQQKKLEVDSLRVMEYKLKNWQKLFSFKEAYD